MAVRRAEAKQRATAPPAGGRKTNRELGGAKSASDGGSTVSTQMGTDQATGAASPLYQGAPEGTVPAEARRKILYNMKLTREVDDRIERKLYRQGKIVGGVYTGRGQEAISVAFTV